LGVMYKIKFRTIQKVRFPPVKPGTPTIELRRSSISRISSYTVVFSFLVLFITI
jgi:hypothetical protein